MIKVTCDKCGEEITDEGFHITVSFIPEEAFAYKGCKRLPDLCKECGCGGIFIDNYGGMEPLIKKHEEE